MTAHEFPAGKCFRRLLRTTQRAALLAAAAETAAVGR